MIITYSTRWSPTAAPPSTGGGTFPFVHLSPPLPCDHTRNIWFRRAPYTCLCLIKRKKKRTRGPEPPRGHFLYLQYFSASVFFFFTGMVKIRTGNSRRGQILCNLQEAAAQRTERSHERQKTELSIIRTPREWSARISARCSVCKWRKLSQTGFSTDGSGDRNTWRNSQRDQGARSENGQSI